MESKNIIGTVLAITGSALSIIGALIFNLTPEYFLAKLAWAASNPMLLIYTHGLDNKWWNGIISLKALKIMYAIFTISNFIGLILL